MANEVSFRIKIDGNTHTVTAELNELTSAVDKTTKGLTKLSSTKLNFAAIAMSCQALGDAFGRMNTMVSSLTEAYSLQESAETRLSQVMKTTMGATSAEIDSIKKLTAEQQKLGVIGDEVQLAGAQELATYLTKTETLKSLIPVMNDMNAQQNGLNATQESAISVATMMGKVMDGQTEALSRLGYKFDENQALILKYGTEEERAAILAEVVNASVQGVNEALAQTPSGHMKQVADTIGDVKERLGEVFANAQPALTVITEIGQSVTSLVSIGSAVKSVAVGFASFTKEIIINKGALVLHKVATLAVNAATKAWTVIQKVLNAVLKMNPLGLVITAIGLLVTAITTAYNKSEKFRDLCNKIMAVIKKLVGNYINLLTKAFDKVSTAISKAWNWLKTLLGLGDSAPANIEETTTALEDEADAANDTAWAYENLAKYREEASSNGKTNTGQAVAQEGSIGYLEDQISALQAQLKLEIDPASRVKLQQEINLLTSRKDAIELEITAKVKGFDTVQDYLMSLDEFEFDEDNIDIEPLAKDLKVVTRETKKAKSATDNASESFGAMGALMNNVGECVGGAAQAWLQYGANLLNTVAQAIPAIAQMISANAAETASENTKTTAKVASASAQTMETYSSIPFVGIALGLAGIAAIVAAMMSLPKFAAGGIAYGPTLGLMGEYAGASNNPEVIAPLNKLRSLLNIDGSAGGKVDFEIRGRKLVGVLAKETSVRSRR